MSISRKEFLARGLAIFGRDLLAAAKGDEPAQEVGQETGARVPALVDRSRCLATRMGCFSCLDGCPREAIGIDAGLGIVIDSCRCDGCGDCIRVCPIEPKPIRLIRSEAVQITTEKGE